MRTTLELEHAWAAGFFEGEGSTTRHGNRLAVQLKNTDLQPLRRFQLAVEVGTIYGPYLYKHERQRKPFWIWMAHDREGLAALRVLAPMLSPRRLVQAEDALARTRDLEPEGAVLYVWLRRIRLGGDGRYIDPACAPGP